MKLSLIGQHFGVLSLCVAYLNSNIVFYFVVAFAPSSLVAVVFALQGMYSSRLVGQMEH